MDLLAVFIDLTKAFETVNREALWIILARMGCPRKLVTINHSLHDGMMAQVRVDGKVTDKLPVTTWVKQGFVISRSCSIFTLQPCYSTHWPTTPMAYILTCFAQTVVSLTSQD